MTSRLRLLETKGADMVTTTGLKAAVPLVMEFAHLDTDKAALLVNYAGAKIEKGEEAGYFLLMKDHGIDLTGAYRIMAVMIATPSVARHRGALPPRSGSRTSLSERK